MIEKRGNRIYNTGIKAYNKDKPRRKDEDMSKETVFWFKKIRRIKSYPSVRERDMSNANEMK